MHERSCAWRAGDFWKNMKNTKNLVGLAVVGVGAVFAEVVFVLEGLGGGADLGVDLFAAGQLVLGGDSVWDSVWDSVRERQGDGGGGSGFRGGSG